MVGIIMEINPFHNGHKYFLEQVRLQEKNSYIVCVITTTITQRGQISILNKEIKTKLLLENGVDLVIELPHVLSNQGGEYYGYHNIKILNDFGVKKIYFGSESNDIKKLNKQASQPVDKPNFSCGYIKKRVSDLKSNDILAISYIKAINKINKNIEYKTIKRINNDYNDKALCKKDGLKICSASAIRENMKYDYVKDYLPKLSFDNLLYFDENKLIKLLIFQLLNNSNIDIFLSENGQIVNKIKKEFQRLNIYKDINKYTLEDLSTICSDKNNSKHKIRRIFINIIFQINKKDVLNSIKKNKKYRVLGFSKRMQKEIKNNDKIFLSYKSKDALYEYNEKIDKILSFYLSHDFNLNYQKPIIHE